MTTSANAMDLFAYA